MKFFTPILIFFITVMLITIPITKANSDLSPEFISAEMLRVKTNPDYKMSINIDAPIQEVFDFLLTRVDAYSPDAQSVSFDHYNSQKPWSLGEGSERITMMKGNKSLVQRLIKIDAPASHSNIYISICLILLICKKRNLKCR